MKKTNGFAGLLMAAMLLLSGGAKAQASIPQRNREKRALRCADGLRL